MAGRERALEPVSVPRAADVVVDQISRAIRLGRFLPGDQLPAERQLAVQLGVSRATLRAALGELESAGLLRRSPHGSGGGALLITAAESAAAHHADARERREKLREIFELRLACEGATAELAAERRGGAELARIEAALGALATELSAAEFRAADNEFHLAIAGAAGNGRLRDAVEDARAAMFEPLDSISYEVVLPSTAEQHRFIFEAIAVGDRRRSRAGMVDHIREAQHELLVALALVED